jgi:cytochrome c biogenesis protein CcmG, thiol:disulfide interchange protein DsbE
MDRIIRKPWALSAAALLFLAAALQPLKAEPLLKAPAPPLTIETADGREFDLGALRGKVVLVDFWATWCAPCIEELPVIEKFYRKHQAEGFEVIALSTDKPRDREKMRRLIAKLPFKAALLSDASRNGFGTPEAVPVSYVIDASGVVRDTFIGLDDQLLDEVVLPLLDKARRQRDDTEGSR